MSVAVPEPDALYRPDVTVASVVCREGRFLLVEERVRGRRVLNQPAGHLEPHEALVAAAARETLEETGWEVAPSAFLGAFQWTSPDGVAFLRFAFAADALCHHPQRPLDAGIERILWLDRDALAARRDDLRSPLVLSAVDRYLAGVRLPLDALHWVPS